MNIGVVSEGPTDALVLDILINSVLPNAHIVNIHPSPAAVDIGTGWTGVQRWCAQFCAEPDIFSSIDRPLNLIIVHVDCSMAWHFDISMDCPPAQLTASHLRRVVSEQWLAGAPDQPRIIIATPSRSTDAWLLIALDEAFWPRGEPAVQIECDDELNGVLLHKRLARWVNGRVKKRPERFRSHLTTVASNVVTIRRNCPEAAIFLAEIETVV
jgi:hypothetical protein